MNYLHLVDHAPEDGSTGTSKDGSRKSEDYQRSHHIAYP